MGRSITPRGACLLAIALFAWPVTAGATPGEGKRLAGAEAQGPATESVTGLHHNPAVLARMPGLQFHATGRLGVEHLTVRRSSIDALGAPDGALGAPQTLINPSGGYFVGTSFRLDPIAIGAGFYQLDPHSRPQSSEGLAYHLANDAAFGCTGADCPPQRLGGYTYRRTDITLAIAWNIRDRIQLGASFHFPRARLRFGRDEDTALVSTDEERAPCGGLTNQVEDPRCAERLAFDGRTRLRLFGLNPDGARFDFALTFGLSFDVGDRWTFGARFRTRPVLGRGRTTLSGSSTVCLPDEAASAGASDVPACAVASPVTATVTENLHREAAIGASTVVGKARRLTLDANLYWADLCPGGLRLAECGDRDARNLELVGLDADAAILPESPLFRGRVDRFGTELWGRYRLKSTRGPSALQAIDVKTARTATNIDLLFGADMASPAVRPGAITAADSEGWELGATVGAAFELPRKRGSLFLVPGYGFDVGLPVTVGPGGRVALYDPAAALDFLGSGGDINTPAADAVLDGRGRPTNAGRYWSGLHTVTFGIRWSERGLDVR